MNAPPCIVYVWRGEGSAPARTGQGLVIASEAIARSFGVFGPLLDEFDDAFIALPCPAEEDDVKRMVDLIVALRARSGDECPICYEALGDNPMRTGCCNQSMHSSCLYRALARTPTCPMCRQVGAERAAPGPRGPSPLPVDADHFLRFYTAAHQLDCSYIVDICAKHLADRFRGKTVEKLVDDFGACDEAHVLCDDLGRLVLHAMPHGAAVTLCEKFRASRRTCRAMSWRTAARLLDENLPTQRGVAFQLVSPVRADAVFAARALVGEQGAHAAEALHRALEEFAPGGIVRDAEDLPACIELRVLADEHFGPWIVPEYATQVVTRPVILHVQARLESRNQPLGVRNVVHIKAGPGCCKTMTARALVKWLGEATARHYADDFSCRTFLLEAYKARTRLTQVSVVDNPRAPGAVLPVGGFEAAEVARVMGELNADPARNYGAGAARKAAIAEAITRPDARKQSCWGSITRWLLMDNERRNGRGESLEHGMGGLKVVALDEAQGAGLHMQLAAEIMVQSGVLVLLLGDPNHRQHLSQDTLNLFDQYPVADQADAFVLRTSFRFDAEGAHAYNAALIPREPGQAIQPLVCGFGGLHR